MTRPRKLTLSVKEFSHLVSESLDIANASTAPQSLVDNTAVVFETPQKSNPFQRIFSRPTPTPTPGPHEDSLQGPLEDLSDAPRTKMIGWPLFSRSPRKNRATKDEPDTIAQDLGIQHSPSYSVTSLAAESTSSLGSLLPAHERLFQVSSRDSDDAPAAEDHHVIRIGASSPVTIALPNAAHGQPSHSGSPRIATTPLDAVFGNESATSVVASSDQNTVERDSADSSRRSILGASFEGTEASHSVAFSEPESFDDDPTPRASTFGPRATALASADPQDGPSHAQRGRQRLSLVVPPRNLDVLSLRPAIGVTPHAPSETGSSVSLLSTSSPTSPVAGGSTLTFLTTGPSGSGTSLPRVPPSTPPNPRVSVVTSGTVPATNLESGPSLGFSPRRRKRAMSRSLTPPPLHRPPPTGPLPAVPSSPIPPVPPLPPLLSKMNASSHTLLPSPPRSGVPTNPGSALPPSPPGGLRLPSRLSWVNSVRAVLPSPPASPTKTLKTLTGKQTTVLGSPSKAEKRRSGELKRPTSIGVIEAADNFQVRRTKSILLLGSKSKSNVSLGPKRVQIHADADAGVDVDDAGSARKARRKSSAAIVGHPTFSESGAVLTPMPSSELLVPRERRHSAPILSSSDSKAPSADWTLSLPFCTDVPGHKILLSPLLTPKLGSEADLGEGEGEEDWTLCMPLKVRVETPTVESAEGRVSESTIADTSETAETRGAMQLPTPSPSPRWTASSVACPALDPEESTSEVVVSEEEEEEEAEEEPRPATPASLGPHVGGLDLAGGRGKRASGWHVYGWFDDVDVVEDDGSVVAPLDGKFVKNHVTVFRKTHDAHGRSQDSMSTVSTSETTFYSARSSLLVN